MKIPHGKLCFLGVLAIFAGGLLYNCRKIPMSRRTYPIRITVPEGAARRRKLTGKTMELQITSTAPGPLSRPDRYHLVLHRNPTVSRGGMQAQIARRKRRRLDSDDLRNAPKTNAEAPLPPYQETEGVAPAP